MSAAAERALAQGCLPLAVRRTAAARLGQELARRRAMGAPLAPALALTLTDAAGLLLDLRQPEMGRRRPLLAVSQAYLDASARATAWSDRTWRRA